ncbi:MAG: hypothetical protein IPO81_26240 [Kouleothrix sp.]|nr:hypothetical protein [Kouleothrix sp.]
MRSLLRAAMARLRGEDGAGGQDAAWPAPAGAPAAIDMLCELFRLSPFERDLLLLCVGVELDSEIAGLVAAASGETRIASPTFSLALAALPGAHWSALAPIGPLRRWRLIAVGSGPAALHSQLRIEERVLHYLAGVEHLDARLAGIVRPIVPGDALTPGHQASPTVSSPPGARLAAARCRWCSYAAAAGPSGEPSP